MCLSSHAQIDTIVPKNNEQVDEQINQNVELLSEQMQSEDGDLSNLTEIYTYLKSHPINLNRAKKEELIEMKF